MLGSNVDLIACFVIVAVVAAVHRQRSPSLRYTNGIKLFVTKAFSNFVRAAAAYGATETMKKDAEEIPVDYLLTQLNLSMMQVDDSQQSKNLMNHQPFVRIFELLALLFASATSAVAFSSMLHCVVPEMETSIWIPLIIVGLFGLALQTLLQIVVATGSKAAEVRMALWLGGIVFAVLAFLLFKNVRIIPATALEATAIHVNALIMQISANISVLPIESVSRIVEFVFVVMLSVFAVVVTLPAIRSTQTLMKMSLGKNNERASTSWITLLWIDLIFCIPLMSVFSPLLSNYMQCMTMNGLVDTCPAQSLRTPGMLLAMQISVVVSYVVIRLITTKKHLQSFMDYSANNVGKMLLCAQLREHSRIPSYLKAIEDRAHYLIPAALQHLCFPAMLWALMLLLIRSSPMGTGMCALARTAVGESNHALFVAASQAVEHNSSSLAVQLASQPYFDVAFWRTLGAIEGTTTDGQILPVGIVLLKQFLVKLAGIAPLNVTASYTLLQSLGCFMSIIWFFVNVIALLMWLLYPEGMTEAISSPAKLI